MDEMSLGNLASWEQYIYPPVSKDLLLGDIIRLKSRDPNDPQSFSVVLTPSCDLATGEGRAAKVEQVLVTGCCAPKQGIKKTPLCRLKKKEELSASLASTLLTQGYHQSMVPFPSLKEKIPSMMADLRDLKLVPLRGIGSADGAQYERVASLDSPFRELISWAYMHTACRPGLPDRDYNSWAKEIVDACDE
jgi:CTP synthase